MTLPTTSSRLIKRKVDDGGPLTLWKVQRDDGTAEGTLVYSRMCSNPECPCQEIQLQGRPLEITKTGRIIAGTGITFRAAFDLSTGELAPPEDHKDEPIPEWIASELTGRKLEDLRERRERYRRSLQSRERWRDLPRRELEEMTSGSMTGYFEVFPDDWDLLAGLDGKSFWALDNYCMNPYCRCRDIWIQFSDSTTGEEFGAARVERGKWKKATFEGSADMPRLWRGFIAKKEMQQALRQRYSEMRRVAAALGQTLDRSRESQLSKQRAETESSVRKVGRNQPCPCGSGRKYKRCCGRQ